MDLYLYLITLQGMKLTFGFLFYFLCTMIGVTVLLAFLYFKPIRHLVFKISQKLRLDKMPVFQLIGVIIALIIIIVLLDSVFTLLDVRKSLGGTFLLIKKPTHWEWMISNSSNIKIEKAMWQFISNWENSTWLKETLCWQAPPF